MNKNKKNIIRVLLTFVLSAGVIFGGASMIYAATKKPVAASPVVVEKNAASQDNKDANKDPNTATLNVDQNKDVKVFVTKDGQLICLAPSQSGSTDLSKEQGGLNAEGSNKVFITPDGKVESKIPDSSYQPVFVEGTPGKGDIPANVALSKAKSAIKSKYALTNQTLSRFDNHPAFNVVNPDEPQWCISFYPKKDSDFSEIGSYYVVLNAKTGEIIEITSAADGVG